MPSSQSRTKCHVLPNQLNVKYALPERFSATRPFIFIYHILEYLSHILNAKLIFANNIVYNVQSMTFYKPYWTVLQEVND